MTELKRKNAVKDFFYGYGEKAADAIDGAMGSPRGSTTATVSPRTD